MNSSLKIRPATTHDLETLLGFEQAVISAERPFSANIKQEKVFYYDLKSLILNENSLLVMGLVDNLPMACGYVRIEQSKPQHTPDYFGYLGFMFVDENYRGNGFNRQILDYLKNWAIKKNITHFKLEVYAENYSAINAYSKYGFKNDIIEMVLDI